MKNRLIILTVSAFVLIFFASSAGAAYFGPGGSTGGEPGLQTTLDDITTAPTSGTSSENVLTDDLNDNFDSYWGIVGGSSTATIIIELAGFVTENVFGIFDMTNPSNKVPLFLGANGIGAQTTIGFSGGQVIRGGIGTGVFFGSTIFGFYLDSTHNPVHGGLWYSDSSLNTSEGNPLDQDKMYAYQGKGDTISVPSAGSILWNLNDYVLAWEDLHSSSQWYDQDYQDMVFMVQSIEPEPAPIPSAILLLGSGLVGLAGLRRRMRS